MFDLKSLRDNDFMQCCMREIRNVPVGKPIRTGEITTRAALCRPRGHYLSYPYALRRLRMFRLNPAAVSDGDGRWADLSRRVALLERRHGLSMPDALQRELTHGAPSRFYLSPAYATRLFQRLRAR